MPFDWSQCVLFAQGEAPAAATQAAPAAPDANAAPEAPPGPFEMLSSFAFPLMLVFLLYYFMILTPERKRTQQKKQLLEQLKKNDKVLTIGGVYGVVANVKPGEDEIVLKIDEDKDVKIKVTKASIAQVIVAKEKEGEKTS